MIKESIFRSKLNRKIYWKWKIYLMKLYERNDLFIEIARNEWFVFLFDCRAKLFIVPISSMVHHSPFNVLHLVMQPAYRGFVRKATNGQLLENFDKRKESWFEKIACCHGHGLRSIMYDIVFIRAILYPRSSVSVTARKPERCFEKGNSGVSVQESKRVFSAYSTRTKENGGTWHIFQRLWRSRVTIEMRFKTISRDFIAVPEASSK